MKLKRGIGTLKRHITPAQVERLGTFDMYGEVFTSSLPQRIRKRVVTREIGHRLRAQLTGGQGWQNANRHNSCPAARSIPVEPEQSLLKRLLDTGERAAPRGDRFEIIFEIEAVELKRQPGITRGLTNGLIGMYYLGILVDEI
ncbi:hypothetical protein [Allohahella sp. A8]|uniref:hypothetical protein n=1 Tax=Allohahella sp. A8 TaxID=3141461 RepID=UPI003A812C89